MEKYTINNVEIEYDTLDADCIGVWEEEVRRVSELAVEMQTQMQQGGNTSACLKTFCQGILDFFDIVIGEGTAQKIFGDKVNVRDIARGYHDFTQAASKELNDTSATLFSPRAVATNRAQRRAEK